MSDTSHNKHLVLAYEKTFAARLARPVLNKPKLSSWMIFIPFIFVFYFQDLSKYKKNSRSFKDNYLLTRKKALEEAFLAIEEARKPETKPIANQAGLNGKSTEMYAQLLAVLTEHYAALLKSEGNTYEELVKSAYGSKKTNFMLFVNRLSQAEKQLNKALAPGLKKDGNGINDTIGKMEKFSEQLRREDIRSIYGGSGKKGATANS